MSVESVSFNKGNEVRVKRLKPGKRFRFVTEPTPYKDVQLVVVTIESDNRIKVEVDKAGGAFVFEKDDINHDPMLPVVPSLLRRRFGINAKKAKKISYLKWRPDTVK